MWSTFLNNWNRFSVCKCFPPFIYSIVLECFRWKSVIFNLLPATGIPQAEQRKKIILKVKPPDFSVIVPAEVFSHAGKSTFIFYGRPFSGRLIFVFGGKHPPKGRLMIITDTTSEKVWNWWRKYFIDRHL